MRAVQIPIPTPVTLKARLMLPAILILVAAILQGAGAWAVLAGCLAFSFHLDPIAIGLPVTIARTLHRVLWALIAAIGLAITLLGSLFAALVIGCAA